VAEPHGRLDMVEVVCVLAVMVMACAVKCFERGKHQDLDLERRQCVKKAGVNQLTPDGDEAKSKKCAAWFGSMSLLAKT
jgi:hypothetical protein